MSDSVRVATPLEYLPRYLCPHCNTFLRYDAFTEPDLHETGAHCDVCGRGWIVTATSSMPHPEHGGNATHDFTLREAQ